MLRNRNVPIKANCGLRAQGCLNRRRGWLSWSWTAFRSGRRRFFSLRTRRSGGSAFVSFAAISRAKRPSLCRQRHATQLAVSLSLSSFESLCREQASLRARTPLARLPEIMTQTVYCHDCHAYGMVDPRFWNGGCVQCHGDFVEYLSAEVRAGRWEGVAWTGKLSADAMPCHAMLADLTEVFPPERVQAPPPAAASIERGGAGAGGRRAARRRGAPRPGLASDDPFFESIYQGLLRQREGAR